jgi:hypothetical protein
MLPDASPAASSRTPERSRPRPNRVTINTTPAASPPDSNRKRVWLKGWHRPQTRHYLDEYAKRALQEHNVAHEDTKVRAFAMNKHVSIDFPDEVTARTFLGTFRENPTVAKDSRSATNFVIYAVQDRSSEDRLKLGRFSPLFTTVRQLLAKKGQWDDTKYKFASSTKVFWITPVTPGDDAWSLFELVNDTIKPNFSELACWSISEDEAKKLIADLA